MIAIAELPNNPKDRGAMLANVIVFELRMRHGESIQSIEQSMQGNKNPRVQPKTTL